VTSVSEAQPGTRTGRAAARRAVVRWALRVFRREWRQQVLVVALLTLAVATAIFGASTAYDLAPKQGDAVFGTASHSIQLDGSHPERLQATLAAADEWFGVTDVIGHHAAHAPGVYQPVDLRTQDRNGAFGRPTLDLRAGRYPTAAGEIAVSDGVAESLDVELGGSATLDGVDRTVVGLVENPSDLADEFALVMPSVDVAGDEVSVLVDASTERVDGFMSTGEELLSVRTRGSDLEPVLAAVLVLAMATVALLLVSLIAVASFLVVAQRRLRQLGMLAAVGATDRDLRLVVVANGVVVGAVGAVVGAILGVAAWVVIAPSLETAVGHRIDRFDIPWWLIVAAMLLAVAAATAAAWWPARTIARVPITLALSGRTPRPRSVHRPTALGGLLLVIGLGCLAAVPDIVNGNVYWSHGLLIIGGMVATVVGVLLLAPMAIRMLAGSAPRLPIAARLAVRDLNRHQARSGAALAAISLVLAIPVAIVVTASAGLSAADEGNLSERQLLIRPAGLDDRFGSRDPDDGDLDQIQERIDRVVTGLDDPTVVALETAVGPIVELAPGSWERDAVALSHRTADGWSDEMLYVASAALLELHGVDPAEVDPGVEVFTSATGELRFLTGSESERVTNVETIASTYESVPSAFITPEAMRRRGWVSAPAGEWIVETQQPLTSEQLASVRQAAASVGLTIESRDQQGGTLRLRSAATVVGTLLALGFVAMTVGLIRGEAGRDLRTLTAAGATSSIRRAHTAATAGSLALLGVVLGTACAYLGLAAGFVDELDVLTPVPVAHLSAIVAGVPLIALAAGWLLAGREPAVITRQAIE
jgi:putative ABC transport system permease protein